MVLGRQRHLAVLREGDPQSDSATWGPGGDLRKLSSVLQARKSFVEEAMCASVSEKIESMTDRVGKRNI